MKKRTGCTWSVIAKSLGYSKVGAWTAARRWAKRNRKSWPPAKNLTFGKICYQLAKNEKMTWKEVAYELGRSHSSVVNAARGHCKYNGIEWPYWGRFHS